MADGNDFTVLAARALEEVRGATLLGLGTGHAATAFVRALGARVRAGLRVAGVPTSEATAAFAREQGIPLVALGEDVVLDAAVDGADEVDPRLDLVKGFGGALVRERVVAAAARRFVVLVGREKLVPVLGTRGSIPVEVVPFALGLCRRRLAALGCRPVVRLAAGAPFVTDNGNHVLDCAVAPLDDAARLDRDIRAIPGVVGTGLFLGMADVVLVLDGDRVERRAR